MWWMNESFVEQRTVCLSETQTLGNTNLLLFSRGNKVFLSSVNVKGIDLGPLTVWPLINRRMSSWSPCWQEVKTRLFDQHADPFKRGEVRHRIDFGWVRIALSLSRNIIFHCRSPLSISHIKFLYISRNHPLSRCRQLSALQSQSSKKM